MPRSGFVLWVLSAMKLPFRLRPEPVVQISYRERLLLTEAADGTPQSEGSVINEKWSKASVTIMLRFSAGEES
ncbi:hypothetical protein [Sphingomonas sp. UYP23]